MKFLIEHGNLTTYEWIHGEAPLRIEEPSYDFGEEEEINDEKIEIEIDFDCIDLNPKCDQPLTDMNLEAPAEIDWGDLEIIDDAGSNVEIDWDNIDGLENNEGLGDIVIEDSGVEGGVARGDESLSILDNRRTRNLILDELHELQAFFKQRLAEIHLLEHGGKGNIFAITGLNVNSDLANNENLMNEVLTNLQTMIDRLTTGKIHHLQLVRSSPKYVDRLVDNLKQKLRFVERCDMMNIELVKKRDSAMKEQAALHSKLQVCTFFRYILSRPWGDKL